VFNYSTKSIKGFTLIELLVVISIIALLSSVILASLNDVRAKGRDSQRIQELKEIQKALELYKSEYGCYPIASPNSSGASSLSNPCPSGTSALIGNNCSNVNNHFNNSLKVLVDAGFLPELPTDPLNETTASRDYCYNYTRSKPSQSAWTCGGVIRTEYDYSISFSVENSEFDLPLQANGKFDYCILGGRI